MWRKTASCGALMHILYKMFMYDVMEAMEDKMWCFLGKKETVHTYSNDPSPIVSLFCLLEWLAMKGVYWWMTMAPTEWQPESHALLRNVRPACLLSSKIAWEAECQDTLVMQDHELVMKWPEILRKLGKEDALNKSSRDVLHFVLQQVCLL